LKVVASCLFALLGEFGKGVEKTIAWSKVTNLITFRGFLLENFGTIGCCDGREIFSQRHSPISYNQSLIEPRAAKNIESRKASPIFRLILHHLHVFFFLFSITPNLNQKKNHHLFNIIATKSIPHIPTNME
jgi:hypothetical protein